MKEKKQKSKKNKFHILSRYNVVLTVFVVIALAIVYCLIRTTVFQAAAWNDKASKVLLETSFTTPMRGRILSDNGTTLAANIEYYKVFIDWQAEGFSKTKFHKEIDKLCDSLVVFGREHGKNLTAQEWKTILMHKHCGLDEVTKRRKASRLERNVDTACIRDRYHILFDRLSLSEYRRLKKFPFFHHKKAFTGFSYTSYQVRQRPLEATTLNHSIGLVRETKVPRYRERFNGDSVEVFLDSIKENHGITGLEGALDHFLYGTPGKTRKEQISDAIINWETKPAKSGYDIMTTINIDIQDILEKELESICLEYGAEWGTAILMEVHTGKIKGFTNISKNPNTNRFVASEYQYGLQRMEPGSLMKAISMTLALEKGLVRLDESIPTGRSFAYAQGKPITDSHSQPYMTPREIIYWSSNIGMTKVILRGYERNPSGFEEDLRKMGFFDSIKTGIPYERIPKFPVLGDKNWHKIALSRMSYGYSTGIPPLYTLAFYNAIANDGVYVRPRLVDCFLHDNKVDSVVPQTNIRDRICSSQNAATMRSMLRDVVLKGTAQCLKQSDVEIAGKTGTSYVVQKGTKNYGGSKRLAFCGFFPYDNPQYSCIVVIQGSSVGAARSSGIVLKRTAEKMYAKGLLGKNSDYTEKNEKADRRPTLHRSSKSGSSVVMSSFGITNPKIAARPATKVDSCMPHALGLPAREAIAILEKKGFSVEIVGSGVVVNQQFIKSTDSIEPEHTVKLTLGLYP